jgi:hypothetical protein
MLPKVQSLSDTKTILEIKLVGWADGNHNSGINPAIFKLKSDCLVIVTGNKIYDNELAKLRACQLRQSFANIFRKLSVRFDHLIDSHDEKDGENDTGEFRKVIVKIKY